MALGPPARDSEICCLLMNLMVRARHALSRTLAQSPVRGQQAGGVQTGPCRVGVKAEDPWSRSGGSSRESHGSLGRLTWERTGSSFNALSRKGLPPQSYSCLY